jgi:phosphatidate cytidylyltransferase
VSNFLTRTITGIIFVIVVVGSIIWKPYIFALLFLVITILGLLEFYRIISSDLVKVNKILGLAGGILMYVTCALVANMVADIRLLLINLPVLSIICIYELYRKSPTPFTNIGYTLLGIFYIALPFSLFNFFFNPVLITGTFHYEIVLGFFAILWINDTGAYLSGMALGRHHLFERISPKKTWEGSIGGMIFSLITAWVLSRFYSILSPVQWQIYALIIIVFGTLGDLVESMLKRSLSIKDSGHILPGHGGILDRFDGVFIAIPISFIYLLYVLLII